MVQFMATLNDVSSEESFVNIYCQNNIHRVRHPSFSFIQIHSEIRKVNWNIPILGFGRATFLSD